MPRNVFDASLFHLSHDAIETLSREDTYQRAFSWAAYDQGFLVQAESRAGKVCNALPYHVRPIFELAPIGTTHLLFHKDCPVLSLPTFEETGVLRAYMAPPFSAFCDDSDLAEHGYEKLLKKTPRCDGSPLFFERRAERLTGVLKKFKNELSEMESLEQSLGDAYVLACGVEYMKLENGLGEKWSTTDVAPEDLGKSLDRIIGDIGVLYPNSMLYTESVLLATRSRIGRSLRVAAEWQPQHRVVAFEWKRRVGF